MSRPAAVVVGCHWPSTGVSLPSWPDRSPGRPVAADRWPSSYLGTRADAPTVPSTSKEWGLSGSWQWPVGLSTETTVIVDDLTAEVAGLLTHVDPQAVQFLSGTVGTANPAWRRLPLVGGHDPVGVHVPVNRLAEQHRHHGFGFTDYLLVLSDRTGAHEDHHQRRRPGSARPSPKPMSWFSRMQWPRRGKDERCAAR